jgi:hypothetical protein
MVAVAFAALNFGAIRACFDSPFAWNEVVLLGALPMANVLGLGLVIALQSPKCRPFLLGFVTFGAAALALYVALLILLTDPSGASTTYGDLINWYIRLADDPIGAAIALDRRFAFTSLCLHAGIYPCRRGHARLAATGIRPDRWSPLPQV